VTQNVLMFDFFADDSQIKFKVIDYNGGSSCGLSSRMLFE